MIKTNDLSKSFDEFQAVDGVSLEIGAGEVLALLGPNGAGKTTTVRMLTSVLKPSRGEAYIAGFNVVEQPEEVRAAVGVLTEHHGLYNRMRAHEYLDFFGQVYGIKAEKRASRVHDLLDHFGLGEASDRRVGEFSKGMRQKLALARALFHEPPVILLDEPTSAMDPASAKLVRDAIRELRSGERAIIICTHNLTEAEELADRIAIIQNGKIITQGTPAGLKHEMLGPPEYRVQLTDKLNGRQPVLPDGGRITATGADWLQFFSEDVKGYNPQVVQRLVADGFRVLSMEEVPRSLEQVYLQAVGSSKENKHAQ
ncbi:MAG: ABC transporter ATP-binding protein [Chloroflexi bacterium]|nr:MAG: ABC transporter ATP-binding protein [Chloroflexota bacterium]MBL1193390.1 ABC transporter ATP-binding protein [Chloroflexota bacterium]NOH10682.1 ABC transporter ATP-binding protein [Chloroflexota bacterium]